MSDDELNAAMTDDDSASTSEDDAVEGVDFFALLPPELFEIVVGLLDNPGRRRWLLELGQASKTLNYRVHCILMRTISLSLERFDEFSLEAWNGRLARDAVPWDVVRRLEITESCSKLPDIPRRIRDNYPAPVEVAWRIVEKCRQVQHLQLPRQMLKSEGQQWNNFVATLTGLQTIQLPVTRASMDIKLPNCVQELTLESYFVPSKAQLQRRDWDRTPYVRDNMPYMLGLIKRSPSLRSWNLIGNYIPRIQVFKVRAPMLAKWKKLTYVNSDWKTRDGRLENYMRIKNNYIPDELQVILRTSGEGIESSLHRAILTWNGIKSLHLNYFHTNLLRGQRLPEGLLNLTVDYPSQLLWEADFEAVRADIAAHPGLQIQLRYAKGSRAREYEFWKSIPQVTWID